MDNMDNIKDINIGHFTIGKNHRPFVIAEMSGNHNQSLDRALALVDAAGRAGVQALKLQTYTADTMTLNLREGAFSVEDPNSLWVGKTLYELYEQAYTPWEWHEAIFERAKQHGMVAFSSPFDETAVDFLESLDVPAYKIASFENTDIPLIERVAKTGKPVIISTGMATVAELHDSVKAARAAGCQDLILLKCTSTYPATPENTNILTIPHMRELFDCQIGLSDHTMGVGVSVAAVTLGAVIVEKHFTLSRAEGGVDSAFSLEPEELKALSLETERAWQALGKVFYGSTKAEAQSLLHRRSLYITQDIKEGEVLTLENVRAIRPGLGLPPKYLKSILGRVANKSLAKGTPLAWDLFG